MKAIRIKPISFGVLGEAVKANTHGNWIYDKVNERVTVQVIVFSEEDKTMHLYPPVTLPATSEDWSSDEQIIQAAFAAHSIEVDTDYKEPIVEEPNVEGL